MKSYPQYKESGSEIIEQIPLHWEIAPLKFIGKIILGKMLTPEDKGGYTEKPYLRAKNIGWETVDAEDIKTMWFSSYELEQYRLEQNDLLISEGGEVGRTAIWNSELDECYIQNSVHKVTILQEHNPRYYLYHSQVFGKTGYYDSIVNRVSIAHLTGEKLKDIRFVVPPLPEQQAIADFLDCKTAQIDTLIEKKQQQIDLLQEQRTALINQVARKGLNPNVPMKDSGVEWLGEIPSHWEISQSKWLFSIRAERARPDDIQLSATQAYGVISQEEFMRRVGRQVTQITKHLEKRGHVEIDDFVISMRSFQGGLERAWERGCIRSSYVVLQPSSKIVVDYFTYLFKSFSYIQALRATSNYLRDGQDMNFHNFSLVALPIIPESEQKEIAAFLDKKIGNIDLLIEKSNQLIDLLEEFRAGLISEAVTGKIDVR